MRRTHGVARALATALLAAGVACATLLAQGPGKRPDPAEQAKKPEKLGKEVVTGGDFEEGEDGAPKGWDEPDGLTVFWAEAPDGKGRCLKFDSAVLKSEWKRRYEEMKLERDKRPKARPKTPPTEKQKYRTIAATYGAQIWSDYFPLEHGKRYFITLKYRTQTPWAKAFVKMYANIDGEKREVARAQVPLYNKKDDRNRWVEYYFTFKAKHRRYKVEWGRVQLGVYWPPGVAYVDDVSVREVLDEEKAPGPDGEKPPAGGDGKEKKPNGSGGKDEKPAADGGAPESEK